MPVSSCLYLCDSNYVCLSAFCLVLCVQATSVCLFICRFECIFWFEIACGHLCYCISIFHMQLYEVHI
ncbi:hypothetical protein XELAEV_18022790mg [Xenopus laevis]|uniref:Uncharacterized protein n=1 Tax=Xenopus laevis TaxID=8355 RepID=A0A974D5F7_XENLA|nr:hypothetical protein XELAEV_18022790mg [Xenopus laevis]